MKFATGLCSIVNFHFLKVTFLALICGHNLYMQTGIDVFLRNPETIALNFVNFPVHFSQAPVDSTNAEFDTFSQHDTEIKIFFFYNGIHSCYKQTSSVWFYLLAIAQWLSDFFTGGCFNIASL